MKKYIFYALLLLTVSGAHAQTIGTMVDGFFTGGHIYAISKLMEGFAYLGGIGLTMKGALKLYAWNESRGREAKLTTGIIYILCGGLLLGLPTVVNVLSETATGSSANTTFSSQSGQYGGQY